MNGAPGGRSPRSRGWRWLRLALGPGILLVILSTLEPRALVEAFAGADPMLLVLAYLLPLPPIALRARRWQVLLGPFARPWRFSELLALYAQSIAAGVVTPGRVGEFAKGVMVARRGVPLGAALLATVIDRMADLGFLAVLAGGALPLVVLAPSRGGVWIWVLAGGTFAAMGLLWVIATSPLGAGLRRRLLRAVEGAPASAEHARDPASDSTVDLVQGFGRGVAARAAVLTVVSWAVTYGANYCFGLSLGLQLSYVEMAGISAVASLVASLPISIAGAGTRDAALIAILAGYGIGSAEAVALSILMLSNVLFAGAVCALAFVVGPLAGAQGDG